MNSTFFYEHFVEDQYWKECTIRTIGMKTQELFENLSPSTAYRFRVRCVDSKTEVTTVTKWTSMKVIAT